MPAVPMDLTGSGAEAPREERRKSSPAIRAQRGAELKVLVAEISARIRPVCGHLSDEEFAGFVLDMARVHLRFRELERRHSPGTTRTSLRPAEG